MDSVGISHSINANAGRNFPGLWKFVEEANEKYIHRPLSTNNFPNLGRPRLDAARFLSAGVPSLSFATYGSRNNYHLPGDNIDIINPEILEDMAQLLFMTVVSMGDYDGSFVMLPEFTAHPSSLIPHCSPLLFALCSALCAITCSHHKQKAYRRVGYKVFCRRRQDVPDTFRFRLRGL